MPVLKRPSGGSAAKHVAQPHKQTLLKRLNRIEGQVRGVARMIQDDRYCVDVITQLTAARAALNAVALRLLEDHTRGCVQSAIHGGHGDHAIGELMQVLRKFSR
jgi:DNA-binding FrmR family transcriptional regulator